MRICLCLFFFIFSFSITHAAQICMPASILASTPDNQLIDNGNGTISDKKTGLMWKKCVAGVSGNVCNQGTPTTFNWYDALAQPKVINSGAGFAGYHDWRLPNIKELTSIVEEQCYDPAINLNRFPNTTSWGVWSGSPSSWGFLSGHPNAIYSHTWWVHFHRGNSFYGFRNSPSLQVRLVRSGQ